MQKKPHLHWEKHYLFNMGEQRSFWRPASKPNLITRPLWGTRALDKPRSSLLVYEAKNGQTTNRKGIDLISRFVVRAQKLIFRCRPSGLGEADQVMPNMAPMYVGHRPSLLCQRESLWMAHLSMCCTEMFPHYCTCQRSASGWPISVRSNTTCARAHSTDYI